MLMDGFLHNHGAPCSLLCACCGIWECMCYQWNLYPCICQGKTVGGTASSLPRLWTQVQQSGCMRTAWGTSRTSASWHRRGNNALSCGKWWNEPKTDDYCHDFRPYDCGAYARPAHKWTCVQFFIIFLAKLIDNTKKFRNFVLGNLHNYSIL